MADLIQYPSNDLPLIQNPLAPKRMPQPDRLKHLKYQRPKHDYYSYQKQTTVHYLDQQQGKLECLNL